MLSKGRRSPTPRTTEPPHEKTGAGPTSLRNVQYKLRVFFNSSFLCMTPKPTRAVLPRRPPRAEIFAPISWGRRFVLNTWEIKSRVPTFSVLGPREERSALILVLTRVIVATLDQLASSSSRDKAVGVDRDRLARILR